MTGTTYRGKPLSDMDKAELIAVIEALMRREREASETHAGDLRVLSGGRR